MALNISEIEREKIFRQVKHRLGAPIRKIELEDEMMSTLLEISIEDYSSYINEWLIESQWTSLYGKDLTITDLTKALTVREMGYEDSFTYAYSKIVGLQARGPWELKHDYVTIEAGKQAYVIPAGREINEVLWITPPTIDNALFGAYGVGGDLGFGGGFAQMPFGGGGGGAGFGAGFFLGSSYDILSRDADFDLKQRIISGDLIYKITAGEKGTKILHLIPPPGSRIMFGGLAGSKGIDVDGSRVWYHYYDVADKEERGRCLNDNKDIIKLPSDVPIDVVDYNELNTPSKQWVRDYFTAMCKETLGRVRGKFGGSLGVTDADVTMDFDSLLNEAKEDKEKLWERLSVRLERLRPDKMLERKALEAENLNKSLQYRPLGHNWNVI